MMMILSQSLLVVLAVLSATCHGLLQLSKSKSYGLCRGLPIPTMRTTSSYLLATKTSAASKSISTASIRASVKKEKKMQARSARFDKVFRALKIYKALNTNLDIPTKYGTPSDIDNNDWPSDLHAFPLGSAVRSIKYKGDLAEYKDQLESIGFQMNQSDHKFELFIQALTLYQELNDGATSVPRNFIVPSTAPWPVACHGMKLGVKVSSTRNGRSNSSPECITRLDAIGFIWDPYTNAADIFLDAVQAFKETNGHLLIPKQYVVPRNSEIFPRKTWGLKLGMKYHDVIYRGDFGPMVREKFEEIGLRTAKKGFDTRHWDYIYSALQLYKEVHGNVRVKPSFKVPSEAPWPESIWGLKLGYRLRNIRYRGDFITERPECQRLLEEELGFNCGKVRDSSWSSDKKTRTARSPSTPRRRGRTAEIDVLAMVPLASELEMMKAKEAMVSREVNDDYDDLL